MLYLITKIFIVIILFYFFIQIADIFKKKSNKKGVLIIIELLQCFLLIAISLTIDEIVRVFI
ncbi:hypothetical protein DVV97_16980 [Clostridium botulinum]|nr:hypothetical protein [Clostridium botulinum]